VTFLRLRSGQAPHPVEEIQVRRMVFREYSGTDWRTCWYICHRWRAAMKGDAFSYVPNEKGSAPKTLD